MDINGAWKNTRLALCLQQPIENVRRSLIESALGQNNGGADNVSPLLAFEHPTCACPVPFCQPALGRRASGQRQLIGSAANARRPRVGGVPWAHSAYKDYTRK